MEKSRYPSSLRSRLFHHLICYHIPQKGSGCLFSGDELLVSSTQTEFKSFDKSSGLVLTLFSSLEKYLTVLRNKQFMDPWFLVPETIDETPDHLTMIERYIPQHPFDTRLAFNSLIEDYLKYMQVVTKSHVVRAAEFSRMKDLFLTRFSTLSCHPDACGAYRIITHGDLWSSNMLFDGKRYYIIDFERVGERFFLFDFFLFIVSEWQFFKDDKLISSYLNGEFDEKLSIAFSLLSLRFRKENRRQYLLTFFVEMYAERWQYFSDNDAFILDFFHRFLSTER